MTGNTEKYSENKMDDKVDAGLKRPGKDQGKNPMKALGRLIRYILKEYKLACITVVVSILISALAILSISMFMQKLIDVYIEPMMKQSSPDYGPLAHRMLGLGLILVLGIICAYAYNRIMVNVTQGTMKRLRVQLFERMESLPISFFDTHAHGDIMSVYTNDVDTLRQVISQSMPQLINSSITFISTLIAMIVLDIPFTVLSVVMVLIMIKATSSLGAKSGRYFMKQQQDLGKVNGYIEEMMSGQKVVKVFCHEEKAYDDFCKLNRSLQDSAYKANMIANITMPVNANLGNISYVLCAVLGGVLAVNGWSGLTIGTLVAFLTLNKSFTMPVTQISQQINAIVMAAAGADRVFTMTDEMPEEDEGYVELVNAKKDADGNLTMQKPIKMQIRENAEMILNIIDSYNGVLPFNDKADSKVIEKEFGISKRAFKTAVGKLLKDGKIRITEKNIEILSEEERAELAKKGTTKADVVKRAKPETKKPVSRRSPEPVPDRKGTVKFTRSNGGRRNNRKALMAELSEMDEE